MNDPKYGDNPRPFDMKRMACGWFRVIAEATGDGSKKKAGAAGTLAGRRENRSPEELPSFSYDTMVSAA